MPEKFRFTAKSIAALRPRADRFIAWDRDHSGLGMRVSPNGVKTAVYLYRFNGKPRFLTLGTYPDRSLEEIVGDYCTAARDVSKARHMVRHELKTPPAELDPAKRKSAAREARCNAGTVAELWQDYRTKKLVGKVRDSTFGEYDRMIKAYVMPKLGEAHTADVRPRDIKALLNDVEARGPVQANRVRTLLAALFRYASDQFIIESSPVRDVRTPAKEAPRDRALDKDAELRGFFAAVPQMDCAVTVKVALPLIIATAARPGEICSMRWSHIDLESGTWQLPESLDKTGKGRTIPLSSFALALLEEAKQFTLADAPDIVFPAARGASITDAHLSAALRKHHILFADHGVPAFRPHDLRRTARTWLAKLKVADHIAERALGHTYGSKLERVYNRHAYAQEVRDAMDLLGAKLVALRAGPNVVAMKAA